MKKERLFDINSLEINPLYISPTEKRKWTVAFTKWCNDQYDKYGSQYGLFCCSFMRICDLCEMKKCNGCADCVETIKECFKNNLNSCLLLILCQTTIGNKTSKEIIVIQLPQCLNTPYILDNKMEVPKSNEERIKGYL